ncbi:MAG: leucine--tRNA ligase [Candidatus Magasanikbacteria bacterium]|nr:leucine--tRNA ligase [Candidatus Magasanikbacteria bacterium]
MKQYNHKEVEKKWKKTWEKTGIYKTKEESGKPKYYVLDMFPYPSGAGLHVGHPKGYIATDIVGRMKMMQGYNVLHPMGWDAFGLPAENYAIKNKVHPAQATAENVATFKKQLGLLGFTYDWDREVNTTDPKYYKWTQWIFLQLFKKGLAYESFAPINWCPSCQTGLANEDLDNGRCERCGSEIERKPMRQWVLKITDYAEKLLDGLDKLPLWPEHIKKMQSDWIGRSEGALVDFKIKDSEEILKIFTTRPDTLFGATYMVVAPEHPLVAQNLEKISNQKEVQDYLDQAKSKSDLERTELQKEKNGVELKSVKAINPLNGSELPVFVADYVLYGYGTGAIMAVPGHDERDWEFAKKYNLPILAVVSCDNDVNEKPFTSEGSAVNSDFLNNLPTKEAKIKMIEYLEAKGLGEKKVQYKLRDWVFSRQRYWGEPMPLIHCEKDGWVAVPEDQLPLELPKVKNYEPSGTGESPLATITDWVNTACPQCGGPAKRETNTMPQWAGSCWYYLAYTMPKDAEGNYDWDKNKINYWNPIDLYVGGAEHATRHLIYARFWHKFLFDIGAVANEEPFTRLQNVGLILAEDGRKMSKRWNNVINPDEVVEEYGADAMRLYEMFMGPFDQPCAWSTKGVVGVRRFLERVWALNEKISETAAMDKKLTAQLHQTIKKVSEDIEAMRFNTAISSMMQLSNEMGKVEAISKEDFSVLLKLLSPFAPHMTEELWNELGNSESIFESAWPKYDAELAKDEEITLAVQVNGKLRDTLVVSADINEEEAKKMALSSEKIQKWLEGAQPKKVIYVKGKLISIVL